MPLYAVYMEEGSTEIIRKVVRFDDDDGKAFLPVTADDPALLKNPEFIEQVKKEIYGLNCTMLDHPNAPGRYMAKIVFNEDGSIKGLQCTPIDNVEKGDEKGDETAEASKKDEKPAEAEGDGKKA